MNDLVFIEPNKIDAIPFTTSDVVAEFADIQHHTATRLIQKYESDFKEFGILRFQIEEIKGRGQPEKHYQLNEEQATLLISYFKNTPKVRVFKKELVRQFFLMRSELQLREMLRIQLKPIRRELTDVIKEVSDDRWMYKHITDLAYKTVTGRNAAQLRKDRNAPPKATAIDYMSSDEIEAITKLESKLGVLLEMGLDYHEIKAMLVNRMAIGKPA